MQAEFTSFTIENGVRVALNMSNVSYLIFKEDDDQVPEALVFFGARTKDCVPVKLTGDAARQLEQQVETQLPLMHPRGIK